MGEDVPQIDDARRLADRHSLTRCFILYEDEAGRVGVGSSGEEPEDARRARELRRILEADLRGDRGDLHAAASPMFDQLEDLAELVRDPDLARMIEMLTTELRALIAPDREGATHRELRERYLHDTALHALIRQLAERYAHRQEDRQCRPR